MEKVIIMAFTHLHVHSEFSLLKGSCRIKDIIQKAKAHHMSSIAITDQNVVYGLIPFYKACKKEGIHPVLGLEIDLVTKNETGSYSPTLSKVVVLAENEIGYQGLLALSTAAQMNGLRYPAVLKEIIFQHKEGLIFILPFEGGEVSQALQRKNVNEAIDIITQYLTEVGKEHVFIELQMHEKADKETVQQLLSLSERTGCQLVATNHVFFLDKQDFEVYQTVSAIGQGEKLSSLSFELKESQYYLKSETEMERLFSFIPEACTNTEVIARRCQVELSFKQNLLPKYPLPAGVSAHNRLQDLCYEGLEKKYKQPTELVKERLRYELEVIEKMNFSDYFLVVWDFMKFAHEQGIITGPGRGSAAGSLVAYLLNITKVDPIHFELLFERFLNPERISMPDIDIDFSDRRRDEVIQYVANKYGKDHVAQIITFGTLAAKAAIRDVGRVLSIDVPIIDKLAKQIPSVPGITLQQALRDNNQFLSLLEQSLPSRQIYELAKKVEGIPRHASTHAAGVVIGDAPLQKSVALQPGQADIALTQYPMGILEEIGLLKMDFLGLRNLTLLEDILHLVNEKFGVELDLENIPFDDEKVYELLGKGETTGIFQLESDGMRKVLVKLKPNDFEDIVAVNALYRPGPMQFIDQYIGAKHKKIEVNYLHPSLEPILKKTFGVIVYQEQIMQIAATMAGFSLGEADILRRAVSKKQRNELELQRKRFVTGAIAKGFDEKVASQIYDSIVHFADYGFNRSHAVAYSVIAYQLAYLKANYPTAFYTALLESVGFHEIKLLQYFREAKRNGISVLPPSINQSDVVFTLEKDSIRFGFQSLKNIGRIAAEEIVNKRRERAYHDLIDFCLRIDVKKVSRKAIETLIISGCFDECGNHRAQLLASLDDVLTYSEELKASREESGQLFSIDEAKPPYYDVPPFTEAEKLKFEKDVVGFYISGHPLTTYSKVVKAYGCLSTSKLIDVRGKIKVAGLVEQLQKIRTKTGKEMMFLTITDEEGELGVTIFPETLATYRHLLAEGVMLCFEGKIDVRNNKTSLLVDRIKRLEDLQKQRVFLKIEPNRESRELLIKIKNTLALFPGDAEVVLYYESQSRYVQLPESDWITVNHDVIMQLKDVLGEKNVVVKTNS
ncbi:DNA polymerase III subunit alpha [Bacillus alkalicellulosilyticus]|uniref:DNA polymerase III subunit alpha n=1 Tax=Alkalihalobacterium alkalicellulosilyticum TaxID=1912214 RepID=UPI0014831E9E|nr:DNA polymerase III subunit alpha [Bacillus alkalicellulosilyticus]